MPDTDYTVSLTLWCEQVGIEIQVHVTLTAATAFDACKDAAVFVQRNYCGALTASWDGVCNVDDPLSYMQWCDDADKYRLVLNSVREVEAGVKVDVSQPDTFDMRDQQIRDFLRERGKIAVIWSLEDVYRVRPDLTEAEAREVLSAIHLYHARNFLLQLKEAADALFATKTETRMN